MPTDLNAYMAGQRAKYAAKDAADNAREDALLHFEANQRAKIAAGQDVSTRGWTPQRSALDDFIRTSGIPGVRPPETEPTAQSVSDEAWNRLGADGRVIDPSDEATVAEYSGIVAQIEDERASETFMHASTRDQLTASGIDVSDPSVRAAYGLDRR
jgi:hypothetical protein